MLERGKRLWYNGSMKQENRAVFLRRIMAILVGVIIFRLFMIQIVEHDKYVRLAEEQQTMQNTIIADRGEIYMMDGTDPVVIAMNEQVWTVLVDPMMADREETEKVVGPILGDKRVAEWDEVFQNKELRYYVLARGVNREMAEKIKEVGVSGVWLQPNTQRVYPEGSLGANVLGFVDAEGNGQYGVEGAMNERLSGENGLLKTVKDVNNIPLTIGDDNVRVPAKDGENIVLTIDRNVQKRVEKALQNGIERSKVAHASAIVMEPDTGKVLAMASLPSYDPANYMNVENAEDFLNDPIQGAYEPASVCKTFAFSAAIDQGVMTPQTTYYNSGSTTVDGWPINNLYKGGIGTITMQTALNWSLNTGSTQALRLLGGSQTEITYQGKEKLYDYYFNRFHLGNTTGFELEDPETETGLIFSPDTEFGTNARYANMTFGQGITLTMVQVASAFSAVVNGGHYYSPTIIAGEVKDGKYIPVDTKPAIGEAISEETSSTMKEMLYTTRRQFVGIGALDRGYYVGGKTGSAQGIRNGEYIMDEAIGSYVGFGATSKNATPKYVAMVKIWENGRALGGEADAKPIFDEISQYMIDYLRMREE